MVIVLVGMYGMNFELWAPPTYYGMAKRSVRRVPARVQSLHTLHVERESRRGPLRQRSARGASDRNCMQRWGPHSPTWSPRKAPSRRVLRLRLPAVRAGRVPGPARGVEHTQKHESRREGQVKIHLSQTTWNGNLRLMMDTKRGLIHWCNTASFRIDVIGRGLQWEWKYTASWYSTVILW